MRNRILVVTCIVALVATLSGLAIGCAPQSQPSTTGPTAPAAEPIIFGVPVPRAAEYGQNGERSAILAAEMINKDGGINLGGVKRPIQLEIADDRDQEPGTPITDVNLAHEKLILEKGVKICIGGPALSEASVSTLDVYAKHKALQLVTMGAATPAWDAKVASDRAKYKYGFNLEPIVWTMTEQYDLLCQSIRDKYGLNKIYFSIADTGYARAALPDMYDRAKKANFEVVGEERHPLGSTDFSALLLDCKAKGAEILYVFDQQPAVYNMAKQWNDMKIPVLPLGFLGPLSDPVMWEQSGGGCNYVLSTTSAAGTVPGLTITSMTKPFFDSFVKRWGIEPRSFGSASTYTGMYALKQVIESTQSLEPDVLVPALQKISMDGVSGRLTFDQNNRGVYGLDPKTSLLMGEMQWQDGKRVSIWPPAAATGEVILPPWMQAKK